MRNAFTEQYKTELEDQLVDLERAIARGVGSWEEYNRLVGKHSGFASALAYFNEILDALDKQE